MSTITRTPSVFSLLSVAALLAAFSSAAGAVTVGATLDFVDQGPLGAPAPDEFTILNISDPGINIVQVTYDLTLADTNFESYADMMPHFPVFDTVAGCSPDYCYGAEADGNPVTPGATGALVGFVDPTPAEQTSWDEGLLITISFLHFESGESFRFTTDVDDIVDFRVSGREFAFATLTVTFAGDALPGGTLTLTDRFFADNENRWRAVGQVTAMVEPIPVPAAVWLFGSGLALLGLRRRKR